MYLGRVVEIGHSELALRASAASVHRRAALGGAAAETNGGDGRRQRIVLSGDVPSPVEPPPACVFHPRCPRFQPGHCDVETPLLRPFEGDHEAACHYPVERWPMTEEELAPPVRGLARLPGALTNPSRGLRLAIDENEALAEDNGMRAGRAVDLARARRGALAARAGRARPASRGAARVAAPSAEIAAFTGCSARRRSSSSTAPVASRVRRRARGRVARRRAVVASRSPARRGVRSRARRCSALGSAPRGARSPSATPRSRAVRPPGDRRLEPAVFVVVEADGSVVRARACSSRLSAPDALEVQADHLWEVFMARLTAAATTSAS